MMLTKIWNESNPYSYSCIGNVSYLKTVIFAHTVIHLRNNKNKLLNSRASLFVFWPEKQVHSVLSKPVNQCNECQHLYSSRKRVPKMHEVIYIQRTVRRILWQGTLPRRTLAVLTILTLHTECCMLDIWRPHVLFVIDYVDDFSHGA